MCVDVNIVYDCIMSQNGLASIKFIPFCDVFGVLGWGWRCYFVLCPKHVEQAIRSAIKPLLHLAGILFPHINNDTRSKSHQIYKLRVFENGVLRKVFGPKRDEVTGEWRKLHNEELNDLYS